MYDYEPIRQMILAIEGKPKVSDKDCGKRLGVSERMIRKARMKGMDDRMADLFAIRLGLHPSDFWNDQWIAEGLFAADVAEGQCTKEDVPALVRSGAWRG